jgi:adhesin transport system outer membrane protein
MVKNILVFSVILSSSLYAFTLKEGFLKTLNNDPEVQVKENDLKKIKYDIDIANGLMYPTLDLRGSVNNSRTSTNSYTPKNGDLTSTDEYSLNLNQPLYDGFEASYEKQLQNNRYESAQYYLKEAQNALALTYTQNYINVLKTKDMLSLSSESYQMSEDIYNKTVRKVERGFGTKLEFERAKGNLEESSVNLAVDRLSFHDAVQSLYNHVQEKFDSTELVKPTFTYNLPHSEEEALSFALANHPSMLVSLKNVEVAMAEQKRDLKSFHPDVNLVGSYKLNDAAHKEKGVDVSNEYQVGIEIAYNLYNGGKDDASNKKSLQTIKEKKILIQKSNQEISNKLALAWNSYTLNAEKLARLQAFVKTRRLVLDTTFEEFDLGTKDLGSVIDAHLDYISTKRSMISTTYDLLLAHFRVLEAIGILSDEILKDKREEIWGKNKIDIDSVVKNNTDELVFSYNTLQNKELTKEEPLLEYLEEPVTSEPAKSDVASVTQKKENVTNLSFKEKFLQAPQEKYTINLATFSTQERSERFINENNITKDSFAFLFGEDEQFYKVMYGVFDTYEEAKEAKHNLSQELQKSGPRVERITIKQNLYKKYNEKE